MLRLWKTTEIASDPKHWGIKYKQLEIIKEIIDIKETQKPIKILIILLANCFFIQSSCDQLYISVM